MNEAVDIAAAFNDAAGNNMVGLFAASVFVLCVILFCVCAIQGLRSQFMARDAGLALRNIFVIIAGTALILTFFALLSF